jgi:hypothetical protein
MMPYFEGYDAALSGLPFGPLDSPLFLEQTGMAASGAKRHMVIG